MASHSPTTYTVLAHIISSTDRAIPVDQPMRENWLLQRRASLPRDEGDLQRLVGDLAFLSFSPQVVFWPVTGFWLQARRAIPSWITLEAHGW